MRTKDGWLFIYHAIDEKDEFRYKMGAMLLDIKYPPRVIARTTHPILEPLAWYENEGLKSGVVYPCGAVILKDQLFVYYGGADMVVCVATAKMNEFMSQLSYEHEPVQVSVTVNPSRKCPCEDAGTYLWILCEVSCKGGDKESSSYNH